MIKSYLLLSFILISSNAFSSAYIKDGGSIGIGEEVSVYGESAENLFNSLDPKTETVKQYGNFRVAKRVYKGADNRTIIECSKDGSFDCTIHLPAELNK